MKGGGGGGRGGGGGGLSSRSFCHLKVIVGGLNDQYEADLVDMQKLKDKNDGVYFLLIVIDVFSRFMWVEPLENKLEDTVINAF